MTMANLNPALNKSIIIESEANMTATDRRIIANNFDNSMTILDFEKIIPNYPTGKSVPN